MMTIHNIAFQGWSPASVFEARAAAAGLRLDGVEYHGGVGYLKAGLANATAITTVSPTYAEEIATPARHGARGPDRGPRRGAARHRQRHRHRGLEPRDRPAARRALLRPKLRGRAANRAAVEARFGLDADDSPLFVVISRLTWQKGIDLLAWITAADIAGAGCALAVLGSGEAGLETFLRSPPSIPGRVGVVIGYDELLAHMMQGGGDAILIPSRFEPCGLTQLYGLRYGCVPIVARVGGLADTVIDANLAALNAGAATGFQFTLDDAAARRRDPPRRALMRDRPPGPPSSARG